MRWKALLAHASLQAFCCCKVLAKANLPNDIQSDTLRQVVNVKGLLRTSCLQLVNQAVVGVHHMVEPSPASKLCSGTMQRVQHEVSSGPLPDVLGVECRGDAFPDKPPVVVRLGGEYGGVRSLGEELHSWSPLSAPVHDMQCKHKRHWPVQC